MFRQVVIHMYVCKRAKRRKKERKHKNKYPTAAKHRDMKHMMMMLRSELGQIFSPRVDCITKRASWAIKSMIVCEQLAISTTHGIESICFFFSGALVLDSKFHFECFDSFFLFKVPKVGREI